MWHSRPSTNEYGQSLASGYHSCAPSCSGCDWYDLTMLSVGVYFGAKVFLNALLRFGHGDVDFRLDLLVAGILSSGPIWNCG